MSARQVRQEAIEIFGASEAGNAILAIEFFIEACGALTQEESLPYWLEPAFRKYADIALFKMEENGLEPLKLFNDLLEGWKKQMNRKLSSSGPQVERLGYEPVNLGTAFHEGKLYYPVQTLVKTTSFLPDGTKRLSERVDIVVIRSDRTLLHIDESSDEQGRLTGIIRLTDGTLLQKKPTASPHASWSWDSIQHYLNQDYPNKPLMVLATRIHRHLQSRVWLPDDDDYWLLTCAAITSYVQAVFDAVPLVLLNGRAGTGKSELGAAMTEVSCNAVMIGQTSPPTMMRLMDEARGLVVIDDLESIGVKNGAGGRDKFSEMVQVLKISYKKSSATKIVTNARKKTEIMNFFGVKIVSNTAGVDAILGSRMLHISTSNMPKSAIEPFLARQGLSSEELITLRNDLHSWAFDNVSEVNKIYQILVSESSQRDEEIAAPLKVIAKLTGIGIAETALESSLSKQTMRKNSHASPEDALKSVMDQLIKEGADVLSISEISLNLRKAMGVAYNKRKPLVWMKPEWVSKKIRALGYVEENYGRKNIFGYQMRLIKVSQEKKIELQAFSGNKRNPYGFCSGCSSCTFKPIGCEILPYRAKKEGLM